MRLLTAAVAAALAAAVPAAAAGTTSTSVTVDRAGAAQLLALVNAERARHGAPALTRDGGLEEIAVGHTLDMARTGVLSHNDALFTRSTHLALGIKVFAENVDGDWTVPGSHADFMESPPHRANLLGADYRLAGFAVVRDGTGAIWVTEDCGTARTGTAATGPAPAPEPAPEPAPQPVAKRAPAPRPAATVAPKAVAPPRVTVRAPMVRRAPAEPYVRDETPAVRAIASRRPGVPAWPLLLALVPTLAPLWLARRPGRR